MSDEGQLDEIQKEWHGTYRAYAIGFIGSVLLTAFAFFFVMTPFVKGIPLIVTITLLAILQAFVQVRYFLHVGQEPHPKWETGIFFSMVVVLLIIVVGTLWIMFDLGNRVMPGMM